jgi:uncharacterized protein with von Willebrand factor type A (vWA) domain
LESPGLARRLLDLVATLRRAGVRIGTGQALIAARAVASVGVESRGPFAAALAATLLSRREDRVLFDQAFALVFGPNPGPNAALEPLIPGLRVPLAPGAALSRRLVEAVVAGKPVLRETERLELDAALTASDVERLARKDFEQMSVEEFDAALELMRQPAFLNLELPTRRWRSAARRGELDARAMLRQAARTGSLAPRFRRRRTRPQTLVLLCDVSGSMRRYARAFLQLAHALRTSQRRVYVYTFATRLTAVSAAIAERDPDRALAAVARTVKDWDGGTRIGHALKEFNRRWSRRILAGGATVILLSDGLERGDPALLEAEAARLRRACRALWWLNPLLRYQDYAPIALGARSLLPAVDRLLPAHDVASLASLGRALRSAGNDYFRSRGETRAQSSRTNRFSRAVH